MKRRAITIITVALLLTIVLSLYFLKYVGFNSAPIPLIIPLYFFMFIFLIGTIYDQISKKVSINIFIILQMLTGLIMLTTALTLISPINNFRKDVLAIVLIISFTAFLITSCINMRKEISQKYFPQDKSTNNFEKEES